MKFYKGLSKIKALSFDLDDTLYDNVPVINRAEELLQRELETRYELSGLGADAAFWRSQRLKALEDEPELDDDVTELRIRTLERAFTALGRPLQGGRGEARALIDYFIWVRSQILVPDAATKLLGDLGARYPLAAISNGNSNTKQDGLARYFKYDMRPVMHRFGSKPKPDLFLEYARLLQLEPSEILHVGDDPMTDVQGAVEAGCQCAWLKGGYAGKCDGESMLSVLPHVELASLDELRELLLK